MSQPISEADPRSAKKVIRSARNDQEAKTPGNLETQLAEQAKLIESLKARRTKDLERLADVTRARDLLEGRLAAQAAKVTETLDKIGAKEKLLGELDQRVGGARLIGMDDEDGSGRKTLGPGGRLSSQAELLWWRWTLRAARRAKRKGKMIEAQILFDAALLSRESAPLWTELAHVLRERRLFDAAEAAYDRALELKPNDAENLFLAGYCAELAGRHEQASRRYEEALTKDPQLVNRYDHLRDYGTRLFG
jgi:tetratricopeptide (TPR) repeat protein